MNVPKPWTSEEDFLGYVDIHSRTERALYHRDHVQYLHDLAGVPCPPDLPEFVSMRSAYANPLVEKARRSR